MTGLVLGAAAAVRSPKGQGPGPADDPVALGWFQDLLGPFGAKADEELLRRGAAVRHHELADRLAAAEGVRTSRPQLLIVTHALPDVVPFTAVAPYLTARLGGTTPVAACFAIGQQGLAAPFTALRIAAAFRRAGRATEVVLAVLEQTTLPTPFPLVHDTPLVDSAAALVLGPAPHEPGEGWELLRVASDASVGAAGSLGSAGSIGSALRREAARDGTLVVLGSWVAESVADALPEGSAVHRTAPGSYCTGVWLELAENRQKWQSAYRRAMLCDTDPRTGHSHLAVFGPPSTRDSNGTRDGNGTGDGR
ncbi:hypothetical protein AB0C51_00285 [Streptomyces pathocidini]|uniref:hypothetical protein n=1 Tax=Streptomyces pathocidini TaxID=1650571 RepID=UPI0033FA3CCF